MVSGDGTIIEAAASRYGLIKKEAAELNLQKAEKKLSKSLNDPKAIKSVKDAKLVVEELDERLMKLKKEGRNGRTPMVSRIEPEAVIQKLKKGRSFAASYKPSVLANEKRIIVAHSLHPSDEIQVVEGMIKVAEKVGENKIEEILLDGGYCNNTIIGLCIDKDISLLCPPRDMSNKNLKKMPKDDFKYIENKDVYLCPKGKELKRFGNTIDKGRPIIKYRTTECLKCPIKVSCTSSKKGRVIKRYESDEGKEALKIVMKNPRARKKFAKRQSMVEPVFSILRLKQNLNRFRRKGLSSVKVEFALHVLAYNIGRLVAQTIGSGNHFKGLIIFLVKYMKKTISEVKSLVIFYKPANLWQFR